MPILENARNVVVNVNGDLVDNGQTYKTGSGLKVLRKASYPEASHDSSSHPSSCFPGTRVQYIEDITGWGLTPATEHHFRMLWMEGPAGVGKSSVIQSCAENIGARLAAAFFFSRPNSRDLSTCLFPSIAYQLATKYSAYHDKLDRKISYDPSLVDKSIAVQFRELIVVPLRELPNEGQSVEEGVIFIDGLDECAGEDAQCTIIDIISASVRDRTTPFIWAFSSRPEPRIVAQFTAPHVHDICWKLSLPVSHDADGDVELYLQDNFRKIRTEQGIPPVVSWPSRGDMNELVRRSKGLFVYPTSVVRFVGEGGSLGPEGQLQLVLQLPSELTSNTNPWLHLDTFYTVIMERIPTDMLLNTLKILLIALVSSGRDSAVVTDILGLSVSTYYAALSKIHSVAKLTYKKDGSPKELEFYHASFTDFLENPERSGRFCVKRPETCASFLADAIRYLNSPDPGWPVYTTGAFWELGSYAKLDKNLLQQLSNFNYSSFPRRASRVKHTDATRFFNTIPPDWRKKIMRPYSPPLWQKLFGTRRTTEVAYVLGHGHTKCGLGVLNGDYYEYCPLP